MWRLARRLCQQDACNDPETLFTGEKYPRERMYIYIYVRREPISFPREAFSQKMGTRAKDGGCVQRHSFKARRYFLVTSRRMPFPVASQELFGQENAARCSSTRGCDSSFLPRFGNTFSNDRKLLASENVIHSALRSRIPRSWNSRTH